LDIDLFTDANYGSIDFDAIEEFLRKNFEHVDGEFGGNPGMGTSYLIGTDANNVVKLDLYYSMNPFFQNTIEENGMRMASVEEIIAMKIDVVQRGGRKKTLLGFTRVLNQYTIADIINLRKQRFEWTYDESLIQKTLSSFLKLILI